MRVGCLRDNGKGKIKTEKEFTLVVVFELNTLSLTIMRAALRYPWRFWGTQSRYEEIMGKNSRLWSV